MIGDIILLGMAIGNLMMAWAIGAPPASTSDILFARFLCLMSFVQAIILILLNVWK